MDRPREVRVHTSLLADVEKRCLVWMAQRLPAGITFGPPDRCSGPSAMLGRRLLLDRAALPGRVVGRRRDAGRQLVRRQPGRHRWRAFGTTNAPATASTWTMCSTRSASLFLVAGLMLGGLMSLPVGAGFLVAYYLLAIEIALATHARGRLPDLVLEGRADRAAHPARDRHPAAAALAARARLRHAAAALRHRRRRRYRRPAGDVPRLGSAQHADAVSRPSRCRPAIDAAAPPTRPQARTTALGQLVSSAGTSDPRRAATIDPWCSSPWTIFSSARRFARRRSRPAWSSPSRRSPGEILERARALKPPLVIFDLNSAKTDPIATIAAMKQDAALAGIRTLGFVSHVDARRSPPHARRAPIHVMARSRSRRSSPRSCSPADPARA